MNEEKGQSDFELMKNTLKEVLQHKLKVYGLSETHFELLAETAMNVMLAIEERNNYFKELIP